MLSAMSGEIRMVKQKIVKRVVLGFPNGERLRGFFRAEKSRGFEVFPAVNGKEGEADPFFDEGHFFKRMGRQSNPGERGCAVSHYKILRQFSSETGEGHDLMLVVEDDVNLPINFERALQSILTRVKVRDFVQLSAAFVERTWWRELIDPRIESPQLSLTSPAFLTLSPPRIWRVGRYVGKVWGTGAYLVTRQGAQRFVEAVNQKHGGKVGWVADDYDLFKYSWGLEVLHSSPSLVSSYRGESHIGIERTIGNSAWSASGRRPRLREIASPRIRIKKLRRLVKLTLSGKS